MLVYKVKTLTFIEVSLGFGIGFLNL